MGIVKRKNGTYEVQIYSKRKMVYSKRGFTSERAAKRDHLLQTAAFKNSPSVGNRGKIFDDLLEKYVKEVLLVEGSPNTVDRYMQDLNYSIKPFFAYRKLSEISPALVSEFRAHLIDEGRLGPKSINMCLSVLSAIFKNAVDWEWMDRSPYKLKPLKLPPLEFKWWDNAEHVNAFLEAAYGSRYYLAYRLALECGPREGEIIGLSPRDVNLERRTIHIWRQWNTRKNKYGPPKHNRPRYISWDEKSDLGDLLRKRIAETTDPDILFSYEGPGHRISHTPLTQDHWYKCIEDAGVPEIRFHDTRHTFASWYMLSGGNEWDLAALMGHKNPEMTRKYAHLKQGAQKVMDFGWEKSRKASARHFPVLKVVSRLNP